MAGGKDYEDANTSAIEVIPESSAINEHTDPRSTSRTTHNGPRETNVISGHNGDQQMTKPLDYDHAKEEVNRRADVRRLTTVPYRLSELILMPEWTARVDDDKRIPCITAAAEVLSGPYELVLRAMWTHIYDPNPNLRHVEVALGRRIKQWLSPSASATVASLFRTAKETRERDSVLGRFMLPGHVQIPSQNIGRQGNDVALMSMFPYFSLMSSSNSSEASRSYHFNHPVRTLFQTRYRLTNPKKRDKNQAIQNLRARDIRATVLSKLDHLRNDEVGKLKLYVPQLWSLLVSGRALITDTPTSIETLCGNELYINNIPQPRTDIDHRIQFIVGLEGKKEQEFSCSADECQCYFALLAQAQRFVQAADGVGFDYNLYCRSKHGEGWVELDRARWLSGSSRVGPIPWRTIRIASRDGHNNTDTQVAAGASNLFPFNQIHPFFTWHLSEKESRERYVAKSARVDVWLIYLSSRMSVLGIETHRVFNAQERGTTLFDHPADISTAYFVRDESAIDDREISPTLSSIFKQTQKLLGLYLPRSSLTTAGGERTSTEKNVVVRFYWLLVSSLLQHIYNLYLPNEVAEWLSSLLDMCIDHAIQLHQGMFSLIADTNHDGAVHYVDGTKMILQIADSFFSVTSLLHDVDRFCSQTQPEVPQPSYSTPHTLAESIRQALSPHRSKISNAFEQAERELVDIILQRILSSSFPDLEPLVTPERILILLLTRLSRGVCDNSTFDIMELYTRIVESLASEVSSRASQFLLTEIDQVDEELDIILEIFNQQHAYIKRLMNSLDPDKMPKPTTTRRANFIYEKASLNSLIADIGERLRDCVELQSQIAKLGMRHARNSQDENGRKLMIFTVVTVTFLPLSFVSSFFGMNLKGIGDTNHQVDHFWSVAIPFTGGVLIVSIVLLYWQSLTSTVSDIRHAMQHSGKGETDNEDEDRYKRKSASRGDGFGEA